MASDESPGESDGTCQEAMPGIFQTYKEDVNRPAASRQPANPASVNALATMMNAVAVPSSKT